MVTLQLRTAVSYAAVIDGPPKPRLLDRFVIYIHVLNRGPAGVRSSVDRVLDL